MWAKFLTLELVAGLNPRFLTKTFEHATSNLSKSHFWKVLYEIRSICIGPLQFKDVILRFRPQKCGETLYFGEKITFLLLTQK